MSDSNGKINSVDWKYIFRWLIIFRSLPIACGGAVIVLATMGVLLTPFGWRVSALVFNPPTVDSELDDYDPIFAEYVKTKGSPYQGVFTPSRANPSYVEFFSQRLTGPVLVFRQLVDPFYHMFHDYGGLRKFFYYLFGGVWSLVIWAFLGCAITRIAVMRYTRDERIGLFEALEFAYRRIVACLGALSMPLAGVAGICIVTALIGLFMAFDFGLFLVSILFFVVLVLAAIIAVLLLGLAFGWPLAISAVSAEGQDSFDAMTKSYAYTFQRPLHYFFYALVAIVFGGLCWLLVARVADGVQNLAYWSTSWGANVANAERVEEIREVLPPLEAADGDNVDEGSAIDEKSWWFRSGRTIIHFWMSVVRTIAAAFLYGHFWCLAGAIYLLLRYDVDEMEMDEVFVSDEIRSYDLPSLSEPSDGVPQLDQSDLPGSDVEQDLPEEPKTPPDA